MGEWKVCLATDNAFLGIFFKLILNDLNDVVNNYLIIKGEEWYDDLLKNVKERENYRVLRNIENVEPPEKEEEFDIKRVWLILAVHKRGVIVGFLLYGNVVVGVGPPGFVESLKGAGEEWRRIVGGWLTGISEDPDDWSVVYIMFPRERE